MCKVTRLISGDTTPCRMTGATLHLVVSPECGKCASGGETEHIDHGRGREFFIDNLLARIPFIIEMIWWTGLAPWEFEFPFPGSLKSTFLGNSYDTLVMRSDSTPKR